MWVIRDAQMGSLAAHTRSRFAEVLREHLKRSFPRLSRAMGDAGLDELIRHGMERSAVHGVVVQADIARYVELMMVLGRDFDIDPRRAWAGAILRADDPPSVRLELIRRDAEGR